MAGVWIPSWVTVSFVVAETALYLESQPAEIGIALMAVKLLIPAETIFFSFSGTYDSCIFTLPQPSFSVTRFLGLIISSLLFFHPL